MLKNFLLCSKQRRFAIYSFTENVISGFENAVSMSCLFESMNGTSCGIATSYMSRDIITNMSSIYLIHRMSKTIDKKPSNILIKSQLLTQIAIVADISSLYVTPNLVVLISGLANIGRSVSWITIGSINAKIIQKLAPETIGEMYSKIAIVNTLGQSLGTTLGMSYIYLFPDRYTSFMILPFTGVIRYMIYRKLLKIID